MVNIYLHKAEVPREPLVVNPPENGEKAPIPPKVTFAFSPGARIGSGADAQHVEKSNGKGKMSNGEGMAFLVEYLKTL